VGDARGKGDPIANISNRHATLVVNAAGAMAMFLVETYCEVYKK
jgi:hypothetical protein